MEEFKPQVKEGHYHLSRYDDLERFISYYYQINLTRSREPKSILEVGVGNKLVSEYLRRAGLDVKTCDIDASLEPDYLADIRNLPLKDNLFDVVMACEVLEHIPFKDFTKALSELERVSRDYVIISLPYRHASFQAVFKFPFVRTILRGKTFLDFCIRIPLKFIGFENSGQHYWEIDGGEYKIRKIRRILKEYFEVEKEVRPVLDSYHEFFILKKRK